MKLKFVKNEKKLYEFDSEKVIWIQTRNKGTDVCLFQQAVKWIPFPLAEVREQLPQVEFIRINSELVVNMNYITFMGTDTCILENGMEILLDRREKKEWIQSTNGDCGYPFETDPHRERSMIPLCGFCSLQGSFFSGNHCR